MVHETKKKKKKVQQWGSYHEEEVLLTAERNKQSKQAGEAKLKGPRPLRSNQQEH